MVDGRGPVGIFDSGVGGLTVFRQIVERLPHESIIYLGDTARVPYGTKSADTVIRYARGCASLLIERGIKILVVACNTASAYALDVLQSELTIPVVGVVVPGARSAVRASRSGRIGVIGTVGTISSGAYQQAIADQRADTTVLCKPCPLFVPLAEEGWIDGDVPRNVAEVYLRSILDQGVDTLVLGCTHYPLLKNVIADIAGPGVALIDSAEATSQAVYETIDRLAMAAPSSGQGTHHFLVTDDPTSFARVGARFLGQGIEQVDWVDI